MIFGLGIRNIGKKAAKILSNKYEDIYELKKASLEELSSLEDFGEIMAKSVIEFFSKEKTNIILEKLDKAGVNLKGSKTQLLSNKLENISICVTGSFDKYSRDEIVKMIEENSGKSVSSVSKKTNILIAGENAGSKLAKAEELQIKIITIDEFLEMIKK